MQRCNQLIGVYIFIFSPLATTHHTHALTFKHTHTHTQSHTHTLILWSFSCSLTRKMVLAYKFTGNDNHLNWIFTITTHWSIDTHSDWAVFVARICIFYFDSDIGDCGASIVVLRRCMPPAAMDVNRKIRRDAAGTRHNIYERYHMCNKASCSASLA